MKLEKEFRQAVVKHKYQIIVSALVLFEEEGIYNSPLLVDYKDYEGDSETKAQAVAGDLDNKARKGDMSLYNVVYEMCWDKMKDIVCDTVAYGVSEAERSKPLGEIK